MKSKTPICDFVAKYNEQNYARFHMPGHKGKNVIGCEHLDITEISGADSLYEAKGIIAESERNAAELFGTQKTLYSTEGSSQCIRAMLYLAANYALSKGQKPLIVATRNAHKVFVLTAALLNIDVAWLDSGTANGLCSCIISAKELDSALSSLPYAPAAVYITSPDYLGNIADIAGLAKVAHKHKSLLLADNAHGAYLKWLDNNLHPMDNGADMCCDSAHKTLPAVTGAAYLHIGKKAPEYFAEHAKDAMGMFGSTSPSYITLQSLDKLNGMLFNGYGDNIRGAASRLTYNKRKLEQKGWIFAKTDEPLKLTIDARENGYDGNKLAKLLIAARIMPEYFDRDYIVLMVSGETGYEDLNALQNALNAIPIKKKQQKPTFAVEHKAVMSMKEALLAPAETIDVKEAEGRVLACPTVSCPPAVPILFGGELITPEAIEMFTYYGITKVKAVK